MKVLDQVKKTVVEQQAIWSGEARVCHGEGRAACAHWRKKSFEQRVARVRMTHLEDAKRDTEAEEDVTAYDEPSASRKPAALSVLGLPFGLPRPVLGKPPPLDSPVLGNAPSAGEVAPRNSGARGLGVGANTGVPWLGANEWPAGGGVGGARTLLVALVPLRALRRPPDEPLRVSEPPFERWLGAARRAA